MFLTSSCVETEKMSHEVAARLKTCDSINTFRESGWYFAYGSKDGQVIVRTHAQDQQSYESFMGIHPEGGPYGHWNGRTGSPSGKKKN